MMASETLGNVVENSITKALSNVEEVAKEVVPGLGDTINHPSVNAVIATSAPTVDGTLPEPTDGSADDFLSCAYQIDAGDGNVQKMVLLANGRTQVSTMNPATPIINIEVPHTFFNTSTCPAAGQAKYFGLCRCGYKITFQVNLPRGSSGAVVLWYAPPYYSHYMPGDTTNRKFDYDTILNAPHVIMDVALNTQVTLVVPYVSFLNYTNHHLINSGSTFHVTVIQPIRSPLSSATHVDWAVFGELLDLDFQAPKFFSQGRRIYLKRKPPKPEKSLPDVNHVLVQPGYGALNTSNSVAAGRAESLGLCNDISSIDFRTSGCASASTHLSDLYRKWNICYSGTWLASYTSGQVLRSSFLQFNFGIFRYLADSFAFFRGSLEYKVLVFTSKFQTGKYQLGWYPYGPANDGPRNLSTMRNSLFMVGDATSTGPILTLPYTCDTWRRPFTTYGYLTLCVVNPLTYNSNTFSGAYYVIMARAGPDFKVMCPHFGTYKWDSTSVGDSIVNYPRGLNPTRDEIGLSRAIEEHEAKIAAELDTNLVHDSQGLHDSQGNPWDDEEPTNFINFEVMNVETMSEDHGELRHCLGRMTYATTIDSPSNTRFAVKPLPIPLYGVARIIRGFAYWSGNLIMGIHNRSTKSAIVAHSYYDSGLYNHWNQLFTTGAVIVPPNESKVVKIPYYCQYPFMPTAAPDACGHVHTYQMDGSIDIFLSFREANFFFPIPLPLTTTMLTTGDTDAKDGEIIQPLSLRLDGIDISNTSRDPAEMLELLSMDSQGFDYCRNPRKAIRSCGHEKTCDVHMFSKLCCDCSPPVPRTKLEDCRGNLLVCRPRYFCSGQNHESCTAHFRRQICCTCSEKFGQLDYFEMKYFSSEVEESCDTLSGNLRENSSLFVSDGDDRYYAFRYQGNYFGFAATEAIEAITRGTIELRVLNDHSWRPIKTIPEDWLLAGVEEVRCVNSDGWNSKVHPLLAQALFDSFSNQGFADGATALMSKLSSLVFGELEHQVMRMVIRTVVRIVAYLILLAMNPTMITTGILATLLYLDSTTTQIDSPLKILCESLINGDFLAFCEAIIERTNVDDPAILRSTIPEFTTMLGQESQGANSKFTVWTNTCKSIGWWLESLSRVITWLREKVFPVEISKTARWLEENQEKLVLTMALADEHLLLMKTDKSYSLSSKAKEKHIALVEMLVGAQIQIGTDTRVRDLNSKISYLISKLQAINFEPVTNWHHRSEPLGIWIYGDPGVGKSFFVNLVTKFISRKFGWGVYANPTGSNHMDGYTDQEIHIFDDFGQLRSEEDYSLICNLISSVPFLIPKAEVTAKGTPYNGKLVMVTTNRRDFSSVSLLDSDALARRFPIKLQIRPSRDYSIGGKLDVPKALRDGALLSGKAWEVNYGISGLDAWIQMEADVFLEDVCLQLRTRENVARMMNQSPENIPMNVFRHLEQQNFGFDSEDDTQEPLFPQTSTSSVMTKGKKWIGDTLKKMKSFISKFGVFIGAGASLGVLLALIKLIKPKFIDNGFYDGTPNVRLVPKDFLVDVEKHNQKLREKQKPMESQGFADLRPICNRLVNLKSDRGEATGLALFGKTVITYAHNNFTHCTYHQNKELNAPLISGIKVAYQGSTTDLAMYNVDLKYQFKNSMNLIATEDYHGRGYLVWKNHDTYTMLAVEDIRPGPQITTIQGVVSSRTYIYKANTQRGTCGGVLIGFENGNPKILGIHTSGNGITGAANRLYNNLDQGLVVEKKYVGNSYHQPRKTKFRPSPFYVNPRVSPAVLSNRDPRLIDPIEDITKKAAMKYRGNTFDPPGFAFELAKIALFSRLYKVLPRAKQISFEKATDSSYLAIDWQTSPGHKYQGCTKKQLIDDEKFVADVAQQLNDPDTYFTTYLKDELRPNEKVAMGKTRAIEASNFDYVIAYRMVMGEIYKAIIEDVQCVSGIAVGMNPYEDFDELYYGLYDNNLCLDFSGFDGSLPPQLMEAAVEVLSHFHVEPDLVVKIHQPVIKSTNLVGDELWKVDGGMCSGAPCTSVLNSICNYLAIATVLISYGYKDDDFKIYTYGDDCVVSVKEKTSMEDLEWRFAAYFGMTVTNFDKSSEISFLPPNQITFLKRSPLELYDTGKIVGALDLSDSHEKIQWMKSPETFEQQLDSYLLEVAIHGEQIYNQTVEAMREIAPSLDYPPFTYMKMRILVITGLM
ncbi:polyprotein [grusopivirus B1]|uniref:Polyprotein n=1 Tax=grusopivirus B1 TaxID=2870360 RepID=A0AC59HC36_9PICO|nr:polyprotein [grusopivirus B1]AUW34306.1 polyprotein [grusopivirus B1]